MQSGAAAQTIPVNSVTLDKPSAAIKIRGTVTFKETVEPANASYRGVRWSSSNAGVATVDENGLVTGHGEGTATITATSTDNPAASGSAEVTVTKEPVTGVTLNTQNAEVGVGQIITLVATVAPSTASYKDITWSSSDTNIATVDAQGVVSGVTAGGTATITAASADDPTKTASAAITVYQPVKITAQPATVYDDTALTLTFSVTFDAAVTVTGAPQFAFTITRAGVEPQERTAAYKSAGSGTGGTATLVFEYAREDYVYGDVNYAADPIVLNGGTIQDAQNKAAGIRGGIAAQNAAATIASIEGGAGIAADYTPAANKIPDGNLTASGFYSRGSYSNPPRDGRLNNSQPWSGDSTDRSGQWWQVDLGAKRTLTKIASQGGGSGGFWWITQFVIKYLDDEQYSADEADWKTYQENGMDKYFDANTDGGSTVTNTFASPFTARYVRVYPTDWSYRGGGRYPAGRFELYVIK